MEVRDNSGRKIGTIGSSYHPGTDCMANLLVVTVVIGGIIFGLWYLIGRIQNNIQSNILPVHDSLRNTQVGNGYPNWCNIHSDSEGLHIQDCDVSYNYSGIKYGDVDVSVTVKLTGYNGENGANATYGLDARSDGSTYNPEKSYQLELRPSGILVHGEPLNGGTPNSAIKTGIGATNMLEVRMHGTHAAFFVNGVKVDEEDFPYTPTEGNIAFLALPGGTDSSNTISVVFTDLTIARDTQ